MIYYIKNNDIIKLTDELPSHLYKIGETYEDYQKGMFVKLSDEQVEYYKKHSNASIYEIWNLGIVTPITPEPPTIDEIKQNKIAELYRYDSSDNVDGFTINNIIPAWFTREERNTYTTSVNAAKLLGNETMVFAVGENILQVPTANAEFMLAALQAYADECYIVTKQHELAINSLETIEEINNYDFTTGYPDKLNFDLV